MKLSIILLSVIGVALSEYCSDSDSTLGCHTVCGDVSLVPLCQENMCTCGEVPNHHCHTAHDCGPYFTMHACEHDRRQCEEGKCKCHKPHDHTHGK